MSFFLYSQWSIDQILHLHVKKHKSNKIRIFTPLDIVFFIFLYQRWVYKVDKSRVNEFGYSAEMEEDSKKKMVLADPAAAPASPAIAAIEESTDKSTVDKKKD